MQLARTQNLARRGFSFAELVIGMAITTLVMAAMMSFTTAVGSAWKANEDEEHASIIANVATARVGRVVRAARLPGVSYSGALDGSDPNEAAIVLWAADTNADDVIQLSELELLGYEKASRAIVRYTPAALVDDADVTPAEFADEALIGLLKSTFERSVVVGKIDGARLYQVDRSNVDRPVMEFLLRVVQGSRENILSVSLSFRAATAAPPVAN